MLQICRYCGIILSLILQRTSLCVHELKTNRYRSVKHNHVFYSGMTTCFGLQKPSSGHRYKNFKMRCHTVQLMHKMRCHTVQLMHKMRRHTVQLMHKMRRHTVQLMHKIPFFLFVLKLTFKCVVLQLEFLESVRRQNYEFIRLSYNGPFERVMIIATKTPWWWYLRCAETYRIIDSVWRIIYLVYIQLVLQTN